MAVVASVAVVAVVTAGIAQEGVYDNVVSRNLHCRTELHQGECEVPCNGAIHEQPRSRLHETIDSLESCHSAVLDGQYASALFEQLRKTAGSGVSNHLGDLAHGEVCVYQKVFRLAHPSSFYSTLLERSSYAEHFVAFRFDMESVPTPITIP